MTAPQPSTTDTPVAETGVVAALLAAAESAIAAKVLDSYAKFLAEVVARVLAGFRRFGVAPDPSALWSVVPLWERLVDDLMDDLIKLARAGWIAAGRQLDLEMPFDPDDPILQDQLRRTRNLMVRTPDEVYRQILKAIGDIVAAGGTVKDQADAVAHVLDVTGTENWPARSKTVAVTEVHRAWNMGALAAALRAQQRLGALTKRWDAKDDSAVRPGHRRADGQTVFINQPFIVNMEALMIPGDPAGSPSNVINCRCKPQFRRAR
jgi:F like protein